MHVRCTHTATSQRLLLTLRPVPLSVCCGLVIDFIDVVRQSKKKVLVHCAQGVSRSTVLAIAYLMYLENSDYDAIYEFVRARRGICRPNVGFMCQLLAWRKRITRCSNRPYCFYRIGPHNNRDPSLVTKWIDRIEVDSMDSRTLFLLQTMVSPSDDDNAAVAAAQSPAAAASPAASSSSSPLIYIWVGLLCSRELEKLYLPYLAHLISKIQAHEHAGKQVVIIRQKGRDKIERAEEIQRKGAAAAAAAGVAKSNHGSVPPSPNAASMSHPSASIATGSSSSASAATSAAAFSSEHISASFHTLDSAPAILSASSLSSLYPAATPKQTSAFYRIVGLEESDDYSRVGPDATHPISSAILLNQSMEEEYAGVRVPDVEALNEVALKHAGIFSAAANNSGSANNAASANGLASPPARHGSRQNSLSRPATPGGGGLPLHTGLHSGGQHRMYLLPPIVRVGLPDKSGVESATASDDDDAGVAPASGASAAEDESMDAYARNLSANSASTAKYASLARVGSVSSANEESNSPVIMLPRKLKLSLGSAGSDGSPSSASSSASSSARDAPISSPHRGSGSGSFLLPSKPKLNLRGITAGGDDSDDSSDRSSNGGGGDVSMSIEAGMTTVPVVGIAVSSSPSPASSAPAPPAGRSHSNSISTPRKVDVSSSSAHSSHANSMASSPRQLHTPASAVAASAASAAAAGRSSAAVAATPSASHLPLFGLYMFPSFEAGPIVCSRSSLVAPHIFLLHARDSGAIFVWMPASAGQGLFIPSKYEGDREFFAGDIAKAFQLSVGLGANMIRAVNVETAGKESEEFVRTLAAGAAAAAK